MLDVASDLQFSCFETEEQAEQNPTQNISPHEMNSDNKRKSHQTSSSKLRHCVYSAELHTCL